MRNSIACIAIMVGGCLVFPGCNDASKSVPNQKAVDALSGLDEPQGSESEKSTEAISSEESGSDQATASQPTWSIATLGNGCYWCTEAVFQELDGVDSVLSGFSGGPRKDVTYEEVCTGTTGHAEVVQVKYDSSKISFAELLQAFFLTHDPTTLNRQGNDIGPQYRSVVFYHDEEQKRLTELAIKELTKAGAFDDPIVTEVTPYKNFIPCPKHDDFFDKNPNNGYCLYNIPKKIEKIRKVFKGKLKSK